MNDANTDGTRKLKSLRLVRETLRELDTDGLTPAAAAGRRTHGHTCGCSWAG